MQNPEKRQLIRRVPTTNDLRYTKHHIREEFRDIARNFLTAVFTVR